MYKRCLNCANKIKEIIGDFVPETAIVLGSGLGSFSERITVKCSIDYKDIEGFPISTVEGHKGRLVFGFCGSKPVVIAEGRVHIYEGYLAADTAVFVRTFKLLGAKNLILTNAAGGINKDLNPGDIMLIKDHISLFIDSPLIGENREESGPRFPDMTSVYDRKLADTVLAAAKCLDMRIKTGIYAQVKGPQYETPAEIKALSILGADAVGMSTVTEAIAAKHCGFRVCALSVITNMAAGITDNSLSHGEVIEASNRVADVFAALLEKTVESV